MLKERGRKRLTETNHSQNLGFREEMENQECFSKLILYEEELNNTKNLYSLSKLATSISIKAKKQRQNQISKSLKNLKRLLSSMKNFTLILSVNRMVQLFRQAF